MRVQLAFAAALLLAACLADGRAAAAERPRPNVVFIMADDLGWADVGFHGCRVPTPRLDGLAREGVELTAHHVAPVCSPTRAGLLTGRLWSRFGVTTPVNRRALPWDALTLPRALQAAGYDTCLTGKWHLGSLPEEGPNHFGFDHSYGSLAGGVTPWLHFYKQGPWMRTWHRDGTLIEEPGHATDLIAAEAVRWSVATAVAGAVLGVNPFDQPDVESAKIAARSLLADFESTGRMPEDAPLAATASLRVYAKGGAGLPGDVDRAMGWLLGTLAPHGYLAVLAFIEMTPAHTAILDRIRVAVRDARKVATTLGYGPRYLHSSGQMHKGGPRGGAYIVITCDEVSDLAIPGRRVSFGAVKLAQARGDFAVLAERERPVLRVHLGANVTEGLEALKACVVRALG